jgi:hypothetical protein
MALIDIPPLEAGAIVCAVAFPAVRSIRGKLGFDEKPHLLLLFLDLLRGSAFFPFLILLAGAFSNEILQHLTSGNRLTVFLAGVIGAVSVFKSDRWMIDFVKKGAPAVSP